MGQKYLFVKYFKKDLESIYWVNTFEAKTARNEMAKESIREICEKTGESPDKFRMRWNALREMHPHIFASPFDRNAKLSDEQLSLLIVKSKTSLKRVKKAAPSVMPGAAPHAKNIQESAAPVKWPLWSALLLAASASIPNMLEVTYALKANSLVTAGLTLSFTATPGLLIYSKYGNGLRWLTVGLIMAYTAFCNMSAIFGGLTGLNAGYIIKPTVFLEAVTAFFDSDYLVTARLLSGSMALIIGLIELLAFKGLAK